MADGKGDQINNEEKVSVATIDLSSIRTDGGTQSRAEIDRDVVEDYKSAYSSYVEMPPLSVFYDGADYWLADGFHRYTALIEIQCGAVDCLVRQGTRRDAVLFSCGANSHHGLRRTNEDKRRAVMTLLNDEEWGRENDQWIANRCGVSLWLVQEMRKEFTVTVNSPEPTTRTGKDGKQYPTRKRKAEDGADPTPAQARIPSAPPAPTTEDGPTKEDLKQRLRDRAERVGTPPVSMLAALDMGDEQESEDSPWDEVWAEEVTDGILRADREILEYLLVKVTAAFAARQIYLKREE